MEETMAIQKTKTLVMTLKAMNITKDKNISKLTTGKM